MHPALKTFHDLVYCAPPIRIPQTRTKLRALRVPVRAKFDPKAVRQAFRIWRAAFVAMMYFALRRAEDCPLQLVVVAYKGQTAFLDKEKGKDKSGDAMVTAAAPRTLTYRSRITSPNCGLGSHST